MKNKPTIILVHGFWGGAAHWSKVIIDLFDRGYTALRAIELPLTSLADDVERTRKMIAQVKGDVLLVGHSWWCCYYRSWQPTQCCRAGIYCSFCTRHG